MNSRLENARFVANSCHGDQKYGDEKPYVYHLDKVVGVLRRFGLDEDADGDLFEAAYGHDLLEDTSATAFALINIAGFTEASLVLINAVTNETGRNRKERHIKTYGKLAATEDAIILKLADRIANCEEGGKLGMYRKEHTDFCLALRNAKTTRPELVAKMWEHLSKIIYSSV